MTKPDIDKYFITLLPKLEGLVKGVCYKLNKNIDTYAAINEAYIHLMENIAKIQNPNQIEAMMVNYINMSIIWTNSRLNKKESVSQHNNQIEQKDFLSSDDINYFDMYKSQDQTDTTEEDLQTKIELEKWWDEKQMILEMYRQQENDKVKQIIFDVFFKKKITKGVDMGKHLRINKDYACKHIRILKSDIREFYSKNNNIK